MSTSSKSIIAGLIRKSKTDPVTVNDLLILAQELNAFEEAIDPDGNPGTALLDTITEYTSGSGTTFTTKAIFGVPNIYSIDPAITALGTNQTNAYSITKEDNYVTGGAANTGLILPASIAGKSITIKNLTTSDKKVYPPALSAIDDETVTTGFITVAAEQEVTFKCVTAVLWQSNIETESLTIINAVTGNITTINSTTGTITTINSTTGNITTLNTTTGNITTANITTLNVTGNSSFQGGQRVKRRAASGAVVAGVNDYYLALDTSGGASTVALLEDASAGVAFLIKDVTGNAAANNVTITIAAGTIDGAASYVLNQNYQSVLLISNGTNYEVN